jgi:glycosyltransferase involved in cell wall biosynthesis
MELAVDARMINSSGIGTYLQTLLPFLKEHSTLTLLGDPDEIGGFSWSEGLHIIEEKSDIYSMKEQLRIPRKVPRCDLFWSPHYNVPLLPLRAGKRVVTIHDVYHLAFRHTLPLSQRIYASVMIRAAIGLSDMVITVSHFSKSEIAAHTGLDERKPMEVIPNGVDGGIFHVITDEEERERVRTRYNLPRSFVLSVGNVKPHKNVRLLLEALSILRRTTSGKETRAVIAGKREGFLTGVPDLEESVSKLGLEDNVILTGHIQKDDLAVLYNLADMLVFPSFYEGFGLPPLEAMACGCPVICSDIGILREVCEEAVLYCNPYDPNSLYAAMMALSSNERLREKLVAKGLERAALFSGQVSALKHFEVMERLLDD